MIIKKNGKITKDFLDFLHGKAVYVNGNNYSFYTEVQPDGTGVTVSLYLPMSVKLDTSKYEEDSEGFNYFPEFTIVAHDISANPRALIS
ncbi:hypothetical protein, partial [Caldisericum sp.]|uniref:hypothetical protein n=1 Tax=Caldisericum sp. TaxID=2499687 RepID=UPI003D0D87C4